MFYLYLIKASLRCILRNSSSFLLHLYRASLRLAYQDIQEESKKKTEARQDLNPQRAQQFERLGMGSTGASRPK